MDIKTDNEKAAVQYFLGELNETAQARLEERFFRDAELSELLTEVEDDLIDRYVREDLSAHERQRFEQHFLVSERRRDKVKFASALLQAEKAASASQINPGEKPFSKWKPRLSFLYAPRPALAYSFAVIAALFLLGGVWLLSEVRDLRNVVAQLETERESRAQQEKQLREQMTEQEQRSNELTAQNEKLEQEMALLKEQADRANNETPAQPSLLAFILSPSSRSSDAPKTLTLPSAVQIVRLQLSINAGDDYPNYQVKLQTANGTPIRSWNRLRSTPTGGGRLISVNVPANLLRAGQYELQLSGLAAPNQLDALGYYYVNLLKP
jgi:cell division protein FtsB